MDAIVARPAWTLPIRQMPVFLKHREPFIEAMRKAGLPEA
jgi:hypothetical protein